MKSGKQTKLDALHDRMENLVEILDSLDPEKTGIDDIDRIIDMLDDLEKQCIKHRQEGE
ncbi:SE1561 family protein [Salipaludibacillus daqingensis]|uniref:SE1561 family protein n=1 Tax=Salipaludibacillus daqingensis TaxID=3041001 RepID=UPI002474490F|nr:SE1561 family protein [Salipaludibacillus daqingensis]